MRKLGGVFIVPLVAVFLASCGEGSLFVPELEQEQSTQVHTIDNGSLLEAGGIIPLRVEQRNGAVVDRIEIVLESSSGEQLGTQTLDEAALSSEEELTIAVPDLEPGTYRMRFTLYNGSEEVRSEQRTFFIARENIRIASVSTYPASYFPESTGLARANIEAPSGTDPYLRWSIQDSVVTEGYLSDGLNQVQVTAPAEEGVYELRLELFPSGPSGNVKLEFASTISQSTELVVRRNVAQGQNDLGPPGSYYALFHFRGNTRDAGARSSLIAQASSTVSPIGRPRPEIRREVFGYWFDGSSGFRVDDLLVPFYRGGLAPFSLNFRIVPAEPMKPGSIFAARSSDGSFKLTVEGQADGVLNLSIADAAAAAEFESPVSMLSPDSAGSVSISVVPRGGSITVVWYRDGISQGAQSKAFNVSGTASDAAEAISEARSEAAGEPSDTFRSDRARSAASDEPEQQAEQWTARSGETVIGGSDGFAGLIDELGIYFRDAAEQPSTDTSLYRSASRKKYGSNLLYAEGFEGLSLPPGLTVEGEATVQQSTLLLSAGAEVTFPAMLFENEGIVLELNREPANGSLTLQVRELPADTELFRFSGGTTVLGRDGTSHEIAGRTENPLVLRMSHSGDSVRVAGSDGSAAVPVSGESFNGVRLAVRNGEVAVRLRSVLAYREGERFQAAFADSGNGTESSR